VLQVIGCAILSTGTVASLYWGLALFLTGSGLNVTCLNMMLTQRFAPDDLRREGAFLWNYAGMNVGFTIGFLAAGYFQFTESYSQLFIFATVGNVLAIALALANWKSLADLNTPLLQATPQQYRLRFAAGLAILIGLVPVLWYMLRQPEMTGNLVKWIGAGIALVLVWLTLSHPDQREQRNMWAYLILTIGSLVFWTLYQMAPNGLQTFADSNVDMVVWGVSIAPQWIQNINTIVIVVGGPTMSALFVRLRAKGWRVDVPQQFSLALVLMGVGFLLLPAGIAVADSRGMVGFGWLFWSFALQAVGELLISPVTSIHAPIITPWCWRGASLPIIA
jgi:POT family proton-dependent oligopeptide transporter